MYYDKAIRLHFGLGYGEDRIAEILLIEHTTAWRWFHKFAAENEGKTTSMARTKKKTALEASEGEAKDDIQSLKAELSALKDKLKQAEMRADLYDEMIKVAEKKFKVEIRKNLEIAVKVIVAVLTAFITAITTTSCMGHGSIFV